jgi:asparagine synthase (glutamine-hydrolysing)
MFAIALWDARRRQLLLVCDRMGVKPLYWHDDGRRIVFGSELKALLAGGDLTPRIDPCALVDYLTFGHVPAPRTILEGVRKLAPATLACCREDGVIIGQYWDIPGANSDESMTPQGAERSCEEFAALFEDAVRMRMVADVTLGAFLSGGQDSASVVAAMGRSGPARVLTHTVGFGEPAFDERSAARETAALLETDHHEVFASADIADTAQHLAWHFDEPFADACTVPTYLLCRETRKRVTVALAGDGADELLGGYRRYRFSLAEEHWRSRMPAVLRAACGLAGELYPKADWLPRSFRARVTLRNIARDAVRAHLHSTSLQYGILPGILLQTHLQRELAEYCPYERRIDLARRYPGPHLLGRLLYLDSRTLLTDRMLTKVDRASMAVGLEVREPFLDYRLVELIARLPANLRSGKQVIRRTLQNWGLAALADRPKRGFEVPLDLWFRETLREFSNDLLTSTNALIHDWIEPMAIRSLIHRHAAGWTNGGAVLWALLSLELWARRIHLPAREHRIGSVPQVHTITLQESAA